MKHENAAAQQIESAADLDSDQLNSLAELVIDWEHLHQISDGNLEFERELLKTFAADTQVRLTEMVVAIAHQDLLKLEYAAHHIKGTTANLGLTRMYAIASKLEKQVRAKSLEEAETHRLKLQESLAIVDTWLAKQS